MNRIFEFIEKLIYFIGIFMLISIIVSIGLQIITRNIFNSALTWPEEISQLLMISMTFIGAFIVEKNDGHIKVDILYSINDKLRQILIYFAKLITLLFVLFLAISELDLLPTLKLLKTAASNIPLSYIHIIVIIGIFLWLITLIFQLVKPVFLIKERDK